MRRILKLLFVLALVVAGMVAGGIAAFYWLQRPAGRADVTVGAWHANLDAGSQAAGMFTRARIALTGLLALNRNETIYFVATADDSGQALTGACQYDVTGTSPPARWWSITLYGEDLFLVANAVDRFSFNQANVGRNGGEMFRILASSRPQQGDWLPAPPGNFILVLRLYNPDPALAQNPAALPAPRITRGACHSDAIGGKS